MSLTGWVYLKHTICTISPTSSSFHTPQKVLSLLGKKLFQRCYSDVWLDFLHCEHQKTSFFFTYPVLVLQKCKYVLTLNIFSGLIIFSHVRFGIILNNCHLVVFARIQTCLQCSLCELFWGFFLIGFFKTPQYTTHWFTQMHHRHS